MDRFDPSDRDASYNKGNNLNFLGKYEDAIQYYDKALEIDQTMLKSGITKVYLFMTKRTMKKLKSVMTKL